MLFSLLRKFFNSSDATLSKTEVEVISLIRLHPTQPLQGSDLAVANSLASRGYLRSAGNKRFIPTEKGIVGLKEKRN